MNFTNFVFASLAFVLMDYRFAYAQSTSGECADVLIPTDINFESHLQESIDTISLLENNKSTSHDKQENGSV